MEDDDADKMRKTSRFPRVAAPSVFKIARSTFYD